MMNRNKSTTDNKKVYNQWAIMLDASVTNGVCCTKNRKNFKCRKI